LLWKETRINPDPDRELVLAAQSGDRRAFDRLVLNHQDEVYRLCLGILGRNQRDAEDCSQEAFLRVYRGLKGFEFKSSFRTWVYTVTLNVCRNALKSAAAKTARRTVSLSGHGDDGSEDLQIADSKTPTPEQALERKEGLNALLRELSRLPENQREALVLYETEGLSYEEIAEMTGTNIGTVRSRISRARDTLKQRLGANT
jgi:RNA polymerase sigma-70 factor (ECF subfamily)